MRINESLGKGNQLGNTARTSPHPNHLAVGSDFNAAIPGDTLDLRLGRRDMGERLGFGERLPHRRPTPLEAVREEARIDDGQSGLLLGDKFLAFEADEGRVVLVDALHRDPVRGGPGGLGEGASPLKMGIIEKARPIDRTDHNGIPCPEQDKTDRLERVVNRLHRGDPSAAEGMPHRRGDVVAKGRDAEIALCGEARRQQRKRRPGGERSAEPAAAGKGAVAFHGRSVAERSIRDHPRHRVGENEKATSRLKTLTLRARPPTLPGMLARWSRFLVSAKWWFALAWLALTAWAIWLLPQLEFRFNLGQMLRGDEARVAEIRSFYKTFPPSDGHLVVCASADRVLTIDHLRAAARWAETFEALPEVDSAISPQTLLDLKLDGFTLDEWSRLGGDGSEEIELGNGPGMETFKGNLVSQDLRSVAVYLIKAKGVRTQDLHRAVEKALAPPWEGAEVRVVGTEYLIEKMGRLLQDNFLKLIRAELIALALVIPLFMRSLRRAYLPLLVSLSALLIYLGIFILADQNFGVIHLAGPGLILIIGLGDAIHLQQHFDEARSAGKGVAESLRDSYATVGRACVLTTVTTAGGFLSLVIARHEEIHEFGVWCAIGVVTAFSVVMLFLPVGLALFPGRTDRTAKTVGAPRWIDPTWLRRLAAPVTVMLALLVAGVHRTTLDSSLERELPEDSEAVEAGVWFSDHFRGLDRIEVDLKANLRDPQVFALVERMQNELRAFPGISGSRSYVDAVRMSLSPDVIETESGPMLGIQALGSGVGFPQHLLTRDLGRACIVFYRTRDFGTGAYEDFREKLRDYRAELPEGSSLELNGHYPMYYDSTTLISRTLLTSLACSLGTITLILMFALRSPLLALLCLIPNAIPLLVVAGISGWIGAPLHLGLLIVFSVGLGLAVDDTIHLMVRFRQLRQKNPAAGVRELLDESVRTTGFAIVLTSVVLLVAAVSFLGSNFTTMRWIGVTLGIVAVVALLADLVVLPWLIEACAKRFKGLRLGAGAAVIVAVGSLVLAQNAGAAPTPTYHGEIAPLLRAKCVECHRPGAGAPIPLTTYPEVKRRSRTIARVVSTGYMPPWHAIGGDVPFDGDRSLRPEESALLLAWIEGGAPEGPAPASPPPPPKPVGEWRLGEPDLVVKMAEAYGVPADGPDLYRHFVLPTGLDREVFVKAVEFRPSSEGAVHHSLIYFDAEGRARAADAEEPEPGFTEMPVGEGTGRQIGAWVPGATPRPLPKGLAHRLAPGGDIVLQTHFHPTGKEELEQSSVALYFSESPPERPFTSIQIPPVFGAFVGIDLPPGESETTIADSFLLPVDVHAFGAQAHAHYRGKSMRLTATFPDGKELVLLNIPEWDMDWQEEYRFAETVSLPAGTRLDVTVAWDNSETAPRNPVAPPVRVRWGLESLDEMGSIDLFVHPETGGSEGERILRTLRQHYRDHLVWQAGAHVLAPDKLSVFGRLRDSAIRRLDVNGDGILDPSERAMGRDLLERGVLP